MPGLVNRSDESQSSNTDDVDFRLINARKVFPTSDPLLICGWGSFEHPNFQDQDAFTAAEIIYALPISKYLYFDSLLTVRNVIFLRKLEDTDSEYFERIEVGEIVGLKSDKIYESTPERDIRLNQLNLEYN